MQKSNSSKKIIWLVREKSSINYSDKAIDYIRKVKSIITPKNLVEVLYAGFTQYKSTIDWIFLENDKHRSSIEKNDKNRPIVENIGVNIIQRF